MPLVYTLIRKANMRKRRFVIRTIKNGQVKIFGRVFKPTDKWLKYDGRLDGQRYAFGLYWSGDEMLPFVELWGLEEAYRSASDDEAWKNYCKSHSYPPDVVYDEKLHGWYYPWATWVTETTE